MNIEPFPTDGLNMPTTSDKTMFDFSYPVRFDSQATTFPSENWELCTADMFIAAFNHIEQSNVNEIQLERFPTAVYVISLGNHEKAYVRMGRGWNGAEKLTEKPEGESIYAIFYSLD